MSRGDAQLATQPQQASIRSEASPETLHRHALHHGRTTIETFAELLSLPDRCHLSERSALPVTCNVEAKEEVAAMRARLRLTPHDK